MALNDDEEKRTAREWIDRLNNQMLAELFRTARYKFLNGTLAGRSADDFVMETFFGILDGILNLTPDPKEKMPRWQFKYRVLRVVQGKIFNYREKREHSIGHVTLDLIDSNTDVAISAFRHIKVEGEYGLHEVADAFAYLQRLLCEKYADDSIELVVFEGMLDGKSVNELADELPVAERKVRYIFDKIKRDIQAVILGNEPKL